MDSLVTERTADVGKPVFRILDPLERFLYESRLSVFIGTVVTLSLLRSGIWFIPNMDMQVLMANNPFSDPFNNPAVYLLWNWLGTFLAWTIHANTLAKFFALHLAFSMAFTASFITLCVRRLKERDARTAIVLFSLLPASFTSYLWVGYDSLTLLLMVVALASTRVMPLPLLAGFLLGMQHFEQAFVATCGVFVAAVLGGEREKEYSTTWATLLVAGTLLGRFALQSLYAAHGVHLLSGRVTFLQVNLGVVLQQFCYHPHAILWSTLGLGWILVIKSLDDGKKAVCYLMPLLGMILLMPIVGDQTRVYALSSFLLISTYWLLKPAFLAPLGGKILSSLFLLNTMMPIIWVWGGLPRWSATPYDVVYALNRTMHLFAVPKDIFPLWPFAF
jgi:hypothetical protein